MHFLSIFIAALSLIRQVSCWGGLGHRTVALLARHYLTDELKQFLDDVLAVEENYKTFDDVAIWADDMERGTYGAPVRPETKIWHYIDAEDHPPLGGDSGQCNINYPDECHDGNKKGCIISAMNQQTAAFISPSTKDARREALIFLIHLIGDLHQPLHVEDFAAGGNDIKPVCFDNSCAQDNKLHHTWDNFIPNKIRGLKLRASGKEEEAEAPSWADDLAAADRIDKQSLQADFPVTDPDKCSLKWARETNLLNCKHVLKKSQD